MVLPKADVLFLAKIFVLGLSGRQFHFIIGTESQKSSDFCAVSTRIS